jgi:hypothetical protein
MDWDYTKEKNKYIITLENGKKYFVSEDYVDNAQKQLSVSVFEALEMWLDDKDLLTPCEEQEQLEKQAKDNGVKVLAKEKTQRKKVVRERKPNPDKEHLISAIANYLQELNATNVNVENVGKLITFTYNSKEFKLDLVEKRTKKQENE